MFAWPFRVDYGWPFVNDAKFKKFIYSHISTKYICTQGIILHPATVCLCSFKELYLFNFKEMIYLLTVKEINSIKEHILFTNGMIIRGNYIRFTELYSFQRTCQFIHGNYIHSRKYLHSMKTYSFREIISIQGNIFIYGTYIRSRSRPYVHSRKLYSFNNVTFADIAGNIYSKIIPSHFMIIISFSITISWIKYSYKIFSAEVWRNCWYDRGFRVIITVRVAFATNHPNRCRHPTLYRAVYIQRNCWTYFKLWVLAQDIPLSFFLQVAFIDRG